jgi:DNA polymerase III subunit alpha
MGFKPYIDLHLHSSYSLLDGVSSPTEIVARAKQLGAPAVALTDHGNVSGIFELYWAAKEAGIKPLLGCEFYMKGDLKNFDNKYLHGILIAMNQKGLENLLVLSSMARDADHWVGDREKGKRPVITYKEIFAHNEGLLFSTACVVGISGASQKKLVSSKTSNTGNTSHKYEEHTLAFEEVDMLFSAFKRVFEGRMFVEVGPARVCTNYDKGGFVPKQAETKRFGDLIYTTNCIQEDHNRRSIFMAMRHNLPLIITTDSHMAYPELKKVQDLLIKNSPDNFNGWHFDQTHAMISSDEMWELIKTNHPYISQTLFEEMIENTHKAAALCGDIKINQQPIVPKFPMWLLENEPPANETVRHRFYVRYSEMYRPGMTAKEMMMEIIKRVGRLPKGDLRYLLRLKEEVQVICDNGITDYTDYFLILSDLVRTAPSLGVGAGPARGSAGGCLLSYLLGITAIDPVKYDLSFVRFLNAGRLKSGHPPDIDTDFTDRNAIIKYLNELYGQECTALVGSFQTIKTKAALKDIVRCISGGTVKTGDEVFKICAEIDTAPQYYPTEKAFLEGFTDDDNNYHPGFLESNKALRTYLEQHPEVNKMLFDVLEKPRNLSKHAGGVVLTSPNPIDRVIPTQYLKNEKCTQVDFKVLEKIGGLKIDVLGVNTLNFIWDTVNTIRRKYGMELDPWHLPEEEDVFKMLSSGDTSTVFQLDTQVAGPILRGIKPKSIHDLALVTAVGRPGCLDSKLEDGKSVATHFIKRRRGEEPLTLLDPILEPVLGRSYGLCIYQESIQKIFEVVGGLTPVESDDARRAIGKKNLQVLLSIKQKLFDNAQTRFGWTTQKCDSLWDSFIGAANYAFNEAHAYAYAVIAYACAYLKKKYPLEWWCSVLSNINSDKVKRYLDDIKDFMSLPSVNNPQNRWVVTEDKRLVSPLTLVLGISDKTVEEISEHAPYKSLTDFFNRVNKRKVNKTAVNNLIVAGCMDGISLKDGGEPLAYNTENVNRMLEHFYMLRDEPAPKKTWDDMCLVKERSRLLSVSSCDYVEIFMDAIKEGKDWKYEEKKSSDGRAVPFLDDHLLVKDIEEFPHWLNSFSSEPKVCFIGMFSEDSKMFHYNDKKEGKRVGAFKLFLENNKQTLETVLWPNVLARAKKGDFEQGALIALFGVLRKSDFRGGVEISYVSHKRIL